MKTRLTYILIIGFLLLSSGCGPSPEQSATMTAAAWTPTPPPTPTSTPAPFDLTVIVTDDSGAPIAGASIVFPGSGNANPVQTDDQGKYNWSNLPGESVALDVSAQGYLTAQQSAAIQRGPNEIQIKLQRDPFGLLSVEACAAGETPLYIEDFQDNHAQNWNEIDLKTPGWNIAPSAEEAGNLILTVQYMDMVGDGPIASRLESGIEFDNAVWRTKFLISKPFNSNRTWFSFNWRQALQPFDLNGQQVFDSRYQLPVGTNYFALRRLQQPVTNIGIAQVRGPKAGEWHLAEISTYRGTTEVWLDGKRLMSYEDPQPIPAGTIGLEFWLGGSDSIVYLDNISVCELSAPYEPPQ